MIKVWGGKATSKELMEAVTNNMDLSSLNIVDVCKRYNMELIAHPAPKKAQRGNSRKIYIASTTTNKEILVILVDYMLKLYDPNYVVLSLQVTLLENGARAPFNLGKERSNGY